MTPKMKITHIAINCEVLINRLNDEVANKRFSHGLKNTAKNFLSQLKKVETDYYDKFFNSKEDSTVIVYDVYDTFMQTIANVPIYEMQNITQIIEAYQKDPKSVEGIVKKILR